VIPSIGRNDEIGAMAAAVEVFKRGMMDADRLTADKASDGEGKVRPAKALKDLTSSFEGSIQELAGGLSRASSYRGYGPVHGNDRADRGQPGSGGGRCFRPDVG
jgi:hypothetical protein